MNNQQVQFQNQTGVLRTADERQMGLFLHLSSLANLVLFPVGYIIPVVLWQTQKETMPTLDVHGKEAVNWMITSAIYHTINFVVFIIGIFLTMVFVGFLVIFVNFLVFIALLVSGIAFSIIAGVKANNGEHWEYPLNIRFIK